MTGAYVISGYSTIYWNMWLSIWGYTLLACIAILGVFFFICWKKRLGVADTMFVIMPVIIGMTTDAYLPWWIRALFLIPIGFLWGLTIMRLVGIR